MRTCKAAYDSDDTETHSSISRKSVARKLMMDTEPDPRKRRHALCVCLWLCVGCIWEYGWVHGLGSSLTSNCQIETQNHHSRRWFASFPPHQVLCRRMHEASATRRPLRGTWRRQTLRGSACALCRGDTRGQSGDWGWYTWVYQGTHSVARQLDEGWTRTQVEGCNKTIQAPGNRLGPLFGLSN